MWRGSLRHPLLLLLTCAAPPSCPRKSEEEEDAISSALSNKIEDAFTVKIPGCTGTLVAPRYADYTVNKHGDKEYDVSSSDSDFTYVYKSHASKLEDGELWADSVAKGKKQSGGGGEDAEWRKVEKIITHGDFQGEALSWKGFDFSLVKIESGDDDDLPAEGAVAPACLASAGFGASQNGKENTYFSGYGRRYVPHCMTDGTGPETYEVCGRPAACAKDHRAQKCGISFVYKGERREECIKDEDTPSAGDPVCRALRKALEETQDEDSLMHVFEGSSYLTTCFPKRAPKNSKGWCTTRPPGQEEEKEPGYTTGWGFCSDDARQRYCNERIRDKVDTAAFRIDELDESFCVEKLGDNLRVEQPEVTEDQFANMEEDAGVVCVGQNHSHDLSADLFYVRNSEGEFSKFAGKPTDEMANAVTNDSKVKPHAVDGGPVCFGDSGGPLFRLVAEEDGKVTPVVVGVFSFILWGTCQGRAEPGYFGKVEFAEDWLKKYLGEEEVCWKGGDGDGGKKSKKKSKKPKKKKKKKRKQQSSSDYSNFIRSPYYVYQ